MECLFENTVLEQMRLLKLFGMCLRLGMQETGEWGHSIRHDALWESNV